MQIRYDPRDMGHVYYLKNNRLQTAELIANPNWLGFFGMSHAEYMCLREEEKQMDAKGERMNLQNKIGLRQVDKEIIKAAEKRSSEKADTKNMRENRASEKSIVSEEHSVAAKAGNDKPGEELKELLQEKQLTINKICRKMISVMKKGTRTRISYVNKWNLQD